MLEPQFIGPEEIPTILQIHLKDIYGQSNWTLVSKPHLGGLQKRRSRRRFPYKFNRFWMSLILITFIDIVSAAFCAILSAVLIVEWIIVLPRSSCQLASRSWFNCPPMDLKWLLWPQIGFQLIWAKREIKHQRIFVPLTHHPGGQLSSSSSVSLLFGRHCWH